MLGPPLFLIYINDIDRAVDCIKQIGKFADDTKIGHTITNHGENTAMQQAIDNLYDWASRWGMLFNTSKCHVLHIGNTNPKYTYQMGDVTLPTSTGSQSSVSYTPFQ